MGSGSGYIYSVYRTDIFQQKDIKMIFSLIKLKVMISAAAYLKGLRYSLTSAGRRQFGKKLS